MVFIFGTIASSLALLGAVFAVAWITAAVFSQPSDKGHLTPKLPSGFISSAFVVCILAFPFLARLSPAHVDEKELIDGFLINAIVVCVVWNFNRQKVGCHVPDSPHDHLH